MKKIKSDLRRLVFVLAFIGATFPTSLPGLHAEEVTLTTYYPAPFGEYDELDANVLTAGTLVVGNTALLATLSGNVGIGTTAPQQKLHLFGDGAIFRLGDALSTIGAGSDNEIEFAEYVDANGAMTAGFRIFNHAASNEYLGIHAFSTSDQGGIDIQRDTGNVGIGTASPGAKLDVAGGDIHIDAGKKIYLDGGTDTYLYEFSDNVVKLTTGTVEKLEIGSGGTIFNNGGSDLDFRVEGSGAPNAFFVQGSDGNVGIGTASPGASLDVRKTDSTYLYVGPDTGAGTSKTGNIEFFSHS